MHLASIVEYSLHACVGTPGAWCVHLCAVHACQTKSTPAQATLLSTVPMPCQMISTPQRPYPHTLPHDKHTPQVTPLSTASTPCQMISTSDPAPCHMIRTPAQVTQVMSTSAQVTPLSTAPAPCQVISTPTRVAQLCAVFVAPWRDCSSDPAQHCTQALPNYKHTRSSNPVQHSRPAK